MRIPAQNKSGLGAGEEGGGAGAGEEALGRRCGGGGLGKGSVEEAYGVGWECT